MKENFAKTKILATLGPATDTIESINSIVEAGVDAFRLNFSHGNKEYFKKLFGLIDQVSRKQSLPIATLIDLQGPKIRIGELEKPEITIVKGRDIEITSDQIVGNDKIISCSYKALCSDAAVGDRILIDDGLLRLVVKEKKDNSVICEVLVGGVLKPKKGMNLPGMRLSTPAITEKDFDNLEFALNHRVDFIALSFVRSPADIRHLKEWLKKKGKEIPIIAKIEKPEAVNNFQAILKESDGIMVARGDLGVEMLPQQVPIIQKQIIRECNDAGKLVITATQMFESMIHNPVPTRAEASDVANAVFDGTDVVMLSGETSVGKYPSEAVKIMNDILQQTESQIPKRGCSTLPIPTNLSDNLFESTGKAIACISDQIYAKLIVVFTHQGRKAKVISKFRPTPPIIAMSDDFITLNRLNLHWGIHPYFVDEINCEETAIKKSHRNPSSG